MTEAKHIDERVASLEVSVSSIAESVRTLAQTVNDGFAQSRRDREASTRDIQAELSRERESRKPQYQTHAAWAGVVLTIVFGAWALTSKGYDRDVERIERSISELQTTRLETNYQRGVMDGRFDGLIRRMTTLEEKK